MPYWLNNPFTLAGIVFQVLMIIHYFRNRPEFWWLFVIFFFGPLGALIYFVVEVVPGMSWKPPVVERFERARRKQWLERVTAESPSQESVAQLAQIVAKEGDHERAIELFSEAMERDPQDLDSRFGRGLARVRLGRIDDAIEDLREVVRVDPDFKFYEAALALGEAYEERGEDEKAAQTYQDILDRTTLSAAYYRLGKLLDQHGQPERARELMQEILNKQTGLPRYLRRQERPWVRKARAFLKGR